MQRSLGAITLGAALALGPVATAQAAAPPALSALEDAFVDIADRVRPSVVTIRSERDAMVGEEEGLPDFFRIFPHQGVPPHLFRQQAAGSGFVLDAEGHILTNNHLVEGAKTVEVHLEDEETRNGTGPEWLDAEIVGADPATDLAVLKLKEVPKDLRPATLGDSSQLRVGQWAIAIGDPYGLDKTVTVGVISALGRRNFQGPLRDVAYQNFIQTDAAINPGNSGGPLVNLEGEVIGISTFILSESGGAVGIGFAIPINMARDVFEDLIRYRKVVRGYLGVRISDIDEDMAQALKLEHRRGALVQEVIADTPAARAGLEHGDIVLEIDGKPVLDAAHLQQEVARRDPDETIELAIVRGGKPRTVSVTLEELPATLLAGVPPAIDQILGMRVQDITDELAQARGLEAGRGVIVAEVQPGSPAFRKGIEPGDVILELGGAPIESVEQLEQLLAQLEPGTWFTLWIQDSDGRTRFIPLRTPTE